MFHDFHQSWAIRIKDALNAGLLPKGLTAMVDQKSGPEDSGVKAIRATARANRIVVKHHLGRTLAVIESVSPGNKDSKAALGDFVEKVIDFLRIGIHVLVVDLFPPTKRDPCGIHKVIWDEILEEDFVFPEGKDRLLVSYQTGDEKVAYLEPVTVGDGLPDMPLVLTESLHVRVPLETTYQATWAACTEEYREAVETGVMPEDLA